MYFFSKVILLNIFMAKLPLVAFKMTINLLFVLEYFEFFRIESVILSVLLSSDLLRKKMLTLKM